MSQWRSVKAKQASAALQTHRHLAQESLLDEVSERGVVASNPANLIEHLEQFREFGIATVREEIEVGNSPGGVMRVPVLINEYWTSRQRAGHSLHEISYRACFKPQLPAFFIERLTKPGGYVYDPFAGRGTTLVEAALRGRVPIGCDINPLFPILTRPRLAPPGLSEIAERLKEIDLSKGSESTPDDLLAFYHPKTLREIAGLREYFRKRAESGELDKADEWIRMVAINRLTGHSAGFFSVYTMPPNQAVSAETQRKLNQERKQIPPVRDVRAIILRKSRSLLRSLIEGEASVSAKVAAKARFITADAENTPQIESDSVDLVVTSPPFLDVVNYAADNWLRCWFIGVDPGSVRISMLGKLPDWEAKMTGVLRELRRVLKRGGHVAFEVGEVRGGKILLEESIARCGLGAGLPPAAILINQQEFTKTSNCWGVKNNAKGTNTNRIVLFQKG